MKGIRVLVLFVAFLVINIKSFAYQSNDKGYSIDEDLIKQISSNISNYVTIDNMPQDLKNAIVAVEDKRFYRHFGIDPIAIARAFITNIRQGKIKVGASTITQQLAKNLFLSGERTYGRKIKEVAYAFELESKYTKDEILEMYLNVIYYGSGAYGIQNASKEYFNKNVMDLSLGQAAMLAGLPQAPSAYNPNKYPERAKRKQKIVLAAMVRNGYIEKKADPVQKQLVFIAK